MKLGKQRLFSWTHSLFLVWTQEVPDQSRPFWTPFIAQFLGGCTKCGMKDGYFFLMFGECADCKLFEIKFTVFSVVIVVFGVKYYGLL